MIKKSHNSLWDMGIIQETYKEKTLEILQNHPYQLVEDIDGIGFKTADELALKTGGTLDNPDRLKAGVIYSIKQSCFSSGSMYVFYDEIKKFIILMMRFLMNISIL